MGWVDVRGTLIRAAEAVPLYLICPIPAVRGAADA